LVKDYVASDKKNEFFVSVDVNVGSRGPKPFKIILIIH